MTRINKLTVPYLIWGSCIAYLLDIDVQVWESLAVYLKWELISTIQQSHKDKPRSE